MTEVVENTAGRGSQSLTPAPTEPLAAKPRTKPIIVVAIVFTCLGGLLAVIVPFGFLFWLNDQYKMASATDIELAKKANQVMTVEQLPEQLVLSAATFSITHDNQGSAFFTSRPSETSYYFEKKSASKLDAVQRRMTDVAGFGDHFTVKERGELPVAGKKLVYARGISQRDTGTLYTELHGYIRVSDKTLVEVATGTPDARPLDMDELKALLASIKSFSP
jgi:hypothetical protein